VPDKVSLASNDAQLIRQHDITWTILARSITDFYLVPWATIARGTAFRPLWLDAVFGAVKTRGNVSGAVLFLVTTVFRCTADLCGWFRRRFALALPGTIVTSMTVATAKRTRKSESVFWKCAGLKFLDRTDAFDVTGTKPRTRNSSTNGTVGANGIKAVGVFARYDTRGSRTGKGMVARQSISAALGTRVAWVSR